MQGLCLKVEEGTTFVLTEGNSVSVRQLGDRCHALCARRCVEVEVAVRELTAAARLGDVSGRYVAASA